MAEISATFINVGILSEALILLKSSFLLMKQLIDQEPKNCTQKRFPNKRKKTFFKKALYHVLQPV